MWYSVSSYLFPLNMSTFTCGKQKFLTTEEVAAIFENRKSVDPLSDNSSSNESLQSSIWESSDVDSVDSDDETEFSGSIPTEIVSEASSQGEASSQDEASSQGEASSRVKPLVRVNRPVCLKLLMKTVNLT